MSDLRFLAESLGPHRRHFALAAVCVFLETTLELAIPLLMASALDDGLAAGDARVVVERGLEMLACALAALLLGMGYARMSAVAAMGLGANLRREEFERVQSLSFSNLDDFDAASLVTRMTTDVTVIQNALVMGFRPMLRGPSMLVMGLVLATVMNARLAVVFFVVLPVLAVVLFAIVRHVVPLYSVLQGVMDRLNDALQEDLRAIRAVKAYVREDWTQERFDEVNRDYAECATRTFGGAVLNTPIFQLSMYVACVALLWVGGGMILDGELEVGTLTGFMSYVLQIMNSLMMISSVFLLLARALTSIRRVREVLDARPAICSPADPVRELADGSVEFRDVGFTYPRASAPALAGVSFRVAPGGTLGVIGGTGSGKSTLAALVARTYDASSGEVRLGGADVRSYTLASLHSAVGLVEQRVRLFSGTIGSNLAWGSRSAGDDVLAEALATAQAADVVEAHGQGLAAAVEERGANFSGGQRQRLSIARALALRPRVLVLDDSSSALDFATEARLRHALADALPGTTKIVISQRVSAVRHADSIVVLDAGRQVGCGTHEELLGSCEEYRQICLSQLPPEEVVA